ncbi:MAG: hypothetical protein MN733_36255, partial [Nitrososphaera sp.]|nr:hypothetical protein [Nitrososphaera sp.]
MLEPTLVTALDGDPNSARAFDFLPGSVLRGAIIGRYLRANHLTTDQFDASSSDIRRLFFDGTTRYLNGYPLNPSDQRALPTPLSWLQDKDAVSKQTDDNPAPIYDFAIDDEPSEVRQPQGVGAPFCFLSDKAYLIKSECSLTVHTTRTRRFGRAMPPSAVYRYEALAAGQTFEAVILCDNRDTKVLIELLEKTDEVMLGGSRSGGYGRVKFENVKKASADWREVAGSLVPEVEGKLIVTLLSDALLCDINGQFVVDPDVVTNVLSVQLETELSLPQAFLRGRAVGGFNRKWGLPLPQALAVEMGSVFVYDAPACDTSELQELEIKGIGERRAEGFGRVAVNWHTEAKWEVGQLSKPQSSDVLTITDALSQDLAERMVKRMLRQQLDERVIMKANSICISNEPPHPAQLSRLRDI